MTVEGTTRNLVPLVRDEVYRIAGEALRNAFRIRKRGGSKWKSGMTNGSFGCVSGTTERALTRRFLLKAGATDTTAWRECSERAKLVGGKLAVRSKLDSGTEAELAIPASVAYAKSPVARRSMFSGAKRTAPSRK